MNIRDREHRLNTGLPSFYLDFSTSKNIPSQAKNNILQHININMITNFLTKAPLNLLLERIKRKIHFGFKQE